MHCQHDFPHLVRLPSSTQTNAVIAGIIHSVNEAYFFADTSISFEVWRRQNKDHIGQVLPISPELSNYPWVQVCPIQSQRREATGYYNSELQKSQLYIPFIHNYYYYERTRDLLKDRPMSAEPWRQEKQNYINGEQPSEAKKIGFMLLQLLYAHRTDDTPRGKLPFLQWCCRLEHHVYPETWLLDERHQHGQSALLGHDFMNEADINLSRSLLCRIAQESPHWQSLNLGAMKHAMNLNSSISSLVQENVIPTQQQFTQLTSYLLEQYEQTVNASIYLQPPFKLWLMESVFPFGFLTWPVPNQLQRYVRQGVTALITMLEPDLCWRCMIDARLLFLEHGQNIQAAIIPQPVNPILDMIDEEPPGQDE